MIETSHFIVHPFVIYGTGRAGSLLWELASEKVGLTPVVGFVADEQYMKGDRTFCGLPAVPFGEATTIFPPHDFSMMTAISFRNMRYRRDVFGRATAAGYNMMNLIMPTAKISGSATIGRNVLVCDFAYVGSGAVIGDDVVVREHSYVGHDVQIRDHVVVSPGCRIAGRCVVGEASYLGIGSTVLDDVTLGAETLVGAGSVVTKDTPSWTKWIGVPARQQDCDHRSEGIVIRSRRERK